VDWPRLQKSFNNKAKQGACDEQEQVLNAFHSFS
jgi:hypothetical protein